MPLAHAAREAREYTCTRQFEAQASRQGWRRVAGCDEAGRGSLLGPLYAAAVILDADKPIRGVDDSKKLTPETRCVLAAEIREKAIAYRVVAIPAAEVDELNVYEASRQAMLRALAALDPAPDYVLTDAMPLVKRGEAQDLVLPHRAIIHGDARSVSIAAASILAKVERDAHLEELGRVYPQYQLARNKGYGTPEHLEALARFGPCPEHRKTFQPVKDLVLPLFPFAPA
ncbi:MAG: ribonuclease HII [Terriglobia bacterium]